MKKKPSPVRVLLAGSAWRLFGSDGAGEALLEAMSGDDEQQRMLAGMSLVKAGDRSIDLIRDTFSSGRATPPVIRLLADLGGPRARSMLKEIAAGEPGELVETARQSLDLLERIEVLPDEDLQ